MYTVNLEGLDDKTRAKALHERFGVATTVYRFFPTKISGKEFITKTRHIWPAYHIEEQ